MEQHAFKAVTEQQQPWSGHIFDKGKNIFWPGLDFPG